MSENNENRKYTELELELALNANKFGGMSLHEAEKVYGVPYSTLRCRKRLDNVCLNLKPGTKPALAEQEKDLVEVINFMADRGFGLFPMTQM